MLVENKAPNLNINEDINKTVEDFSNILLSAAEESIGKTEYVKNRKPVPWWNTECERAIKESKQALNRYKKHKTSENLLIFKNMRARTRFIIKKK
ncbi:hypothetical protein NQ314_006444 [Rhamnusium bicolor]|uniref:Uncharacterized protein n=1 Tax=Rhamnusium bicolor TaxID=1586634 RepID=A0AAV8Z2B7_9CUCU|nr:hypothetical protein NQ314_006444 [Rhamnusium bicolor]